MRYLISIVILISCKPISRTDHNVVKETDSQELSVRLLPYEEGSVLVACHQEQCQNLLLDKDSKEVSPYVFFNPDSIPLEVAGEKEKKSALRKGLAIGGAVVMGALALVGVKRLHTLSDQMDIVDVLKWRHAEDGALVTGQKITDKEDILTLTAREKEIMDMSVKPHQQKLIRLPFFSDTILMYDVEQLKRLEDAVRNILLADKSKGRALARGNYSEITGQFSDSASHLDRADISFANKQLSEGLRDLDMVFHGSKISKGEWRPVVTGLLAFIPLTLVTSFSLDIRNDRKLKAQTDNIFSLFSERKPISLTFDELKRLLRIFSMYLPTKIDKNSIKELSASMS